MATYTLTELGNKSGEVTEAAFRGPVDITSRGKRKFVLLTAERFDWLTQASAQRVVRADDLTDRQRVELLAGLDEIVARDGDG